MGLTTIKLPVAVKPAGPAQLYALAPDAVRVTLSPDEQMLVALGVIVMVGAEFTVTATEEVAEQPLEVPVTV